MTFGTIHVGDIGTVIELTVVDANDTPINISTATVKKFYITKPTGVSVEKTAVFSTDGSDGKLKYLTIAGDIDMQGTWQVQGYVNMPAGEYFTGLLYFVVQPTLVTDITPPVYVTTLFSVMLQVYEILQLGFSSTATGGSATTLVDSSNVFASDYYKNGTLFIQSGANIGKCPKVTAFSNGAFTFASQTSLCGAGDTYTAFRKTYSKQAIQRAVWIALKDLGKITALDSSLLTVADQEEYTLPSGVSDLVQVQIAQNLAVDWEWGNPWHSWREENGKLRFNPGARPAWTGYTIRLFYNKEHDFITADTGVIDPQIDPLRLAWTAAYYAAANRRMRSSSDEPRQMELINRCAEMVAMLKKERPVKRLPRTVRFATWP